MTALEFPKLTGTAGKQNSYPGKVLEHPTLSELPVFENIHMTIKDNCSHIAF